MFSKTIFIPKFCVIQVKSFSLLKVSAKRDNRRYDLNEDVAEKRISTEPKQRFADIVTTRGSNHIQSTLIRVAALQHPNIPLS